MQRSFIELKDEYLEKAKELSEPNDKINNIFFEAIKKIRAINSFEINSILDHIVDQNLDNKDPLSFNSNNLDNLDILISNQYVPLELGKTELDQLNLVFFLTKKKIIEEITTLHDLQQILEQESDQLPEEVNISKDFSPFTDEKEPIQELLEEEISNEILLKKIDGTINHYNSLINSLEKNHEPSKMTAAMVDISKYKDAIKELIV